MRKWLSAIAVGAVMAAAMVALAWMVLAPITRDRNIDARSAAAGRNLTRMMAAERFWSHAHGVQGAAPSSAKRANDAGWLEFRLAPGDTSDPAWRALGLDLDAGAIEHEYRARVHDGKLWIVARGNLDGDASVDDWEIDSDGEVSVPRQVFDDVREIYVAVVYYDEMGRKYREPNADLTFEERAQVKILRATTSATLSAGTAGIP